MSQAAGELPDRWFVVGVGAADDVIGPGDGRNVRWLRGRRAGRPVRSGRRRAEAPAAVRADRRLGAHDACPRGQRRGVGLRRRPHRRRRTGPRPGACAPRSTPSPDPSGSWWSPTGRTRSPRRRPAATTPTRCRCRPPWTTRWPAATPTR